MFLKQPAYGRRRRGFLRRSLGYADLVRESEILVITEISDFRTTPEATFQPRWTVLGSVRRSLGLS